MQTDSPNIRFANVLAELKKKGITQRMLYNEIPPDKVHSFDNKDETYITKLKTGAIKRIPNDFIAHLHEHYRINPEYLNMESDCMFDLIDKKLDNFLSIVDECRVVSGEEREYLHLTIDQNIVDLLIDLCKAKTIIEEEGISSYEQEKLSLIELHSSNPKPKEYVLVERNNFRKIIDSSIEHKNKIDDIIKAWEYDD